MAQSVWHKHDIENVLRGVELTCQQMAAQFDGPECDSYRRGFLAALAAAATSFGIQVNTLPLSPPLDGSQRPNRRLRELTPPREAA
jgi:hypothetical protein